MRNITVDEMDTQLLFNHAGADSIMDELTDALGSHNEDVIVQVSSSTFYNTHTVTYPLLAV